MALVLAIIITIREKQQRDAGGEHRQRQQLTHGQPVERDESEVGIRLAEELRDPAENRVSSQKQSTYGPGRPRSSGKDPHDNEKREPFQGCLVELRRMTGQMVQCPRFPGLLQGHARKILTGERGRKDHCPRRIAATAVKFTADEVTQTTESEPKRHHLRDEIAKGQEPHADMARKQRHRYQHADEATVKRHAPLLQPDWK